MDEDKEKAAPRLSREGEAARAERQRRLARAMRDNLRKRKTQRAARQARPSEDGPERQ